MCGSPGKQRDKENILRATDVCSRLAESTLFPSRTEQSILTDSNFIVKVPNVTVLIEVPVGSFPECESHELINCMFAI